MTILHGGSLERGALPENPVLIPKGANRVFRGEIFDVYQWQQQMFDGSYKTFEMLKRPHTVLIVALDENNKVVVLNESQPSVGSWSFSMPGGRVDATDVSILEAAKREMREETGYELASWKLIDVIQPQRKIEWFIYTFLAQNIVSRGPTNHDSGEKIETVHVDFEEFIQNSKDARRSNVFNTYTSIEELRKLKEFK